MTPFRGWNWFRTEFLRLVGTVIRSRNVGRQMAVVETWMEVRRLAFSFNQHQVRDRWESRAPDRRSPHFSTIAPPPPHPPPHPTTTTTTTTLGTNPPHPHPHPHIPYAQLPPPLPHFIPSRPFRTSPTPPHSCLSWTRRCQNFPARTSLGGTDIWKAWCDGSNASTTRRRKAATPPPWGKYRLTQKKMQIALGQARWDYVNNILIDRLGNNNNKPFWSFVNSRHQDMVAVAPLKDEGTRHMDSTEKAHILNCQLQRVVTQEGNSPLPNSASPSYPSIGPLEINFPGIAKLLSSLKVNKAAGPDDLPCHILKELAVEIDQILTDICNQWLKSGELPSDWVKVNIAPIFKKGNTNIVENYRLVSLTCVCCKILEHTVLMQARSGSLRTA